MTTLLELRCGMRRCPKCPVANDFEGRIVFGEGPEDARVMLVGEAPGKEESYTALPFVGTSGQFLNKILSSVGIPRSALFITHAIQCRPPENRDPTKDELGSCAHNLFTKIAIIKPKLIVTLGRHSARVLTGKAVDLKVLRNLNLSYQGIPVIATIHPAGLIYDMRRKQSAWNDWCKIAAVYRSLCGTVQAEVQTGFFPVP